MRMMPAHTARYARIDSAFFHQLQPRMNLRPITAIPAKARANRSQPSKVFLFSSNTAAIRMLIRIVKIHPGVFILVFLHETG